MKEGRNEFLIVMVLFVMGVVLVATGISIVLWVVITNYHDAIQAAQAAK